MPAHQRVSQRGSRPDRPASPAPHRPATCLIGCSGWQYKHWRGDFCPASLPRAAGSLITPGNSIQLRSITRSTGCRRRRHFAAWRQRAPRGFVFCGEGEPVPHRSSSSFREPGSLGQLSGRSCISCHLAGRSIGGMAVGSSPAGVDVYAYFNNDAGGHARLAKAEGRALQSRHSHHL